MRIVKYEDLPTEIQKDIASSVGDKDGGMSPQGVLEALAKGGYMDCNYTKKELREEIKKMVKNGTLVQNVFDQQLHYPGWRPNESQREWEESHNGRWEHRRKKVKWDYETTKEKYVVLLPNGVEKTYEKISQIYADLGPDAGRAVTKNLKGFDNEYKTRIEVEKKRVKGSGYRDVEVFVKPPKKREKNV